MAHIVVLFALLAFIKQAAAFPKTENGITAAEESTFATVMTAALLPSTSSPPASYHVSCTTDQSKFKFGTFSGIPDERKRWREGYNVVLDKNFSKRTFSYLKL